MSAMATRSEDTRRFIAALIGGEVGAAFGLVFFGWLLFAPLVLALAGSALGAASLTIRRRARQKLAERYLRTALRS
jgi:hypothetical protein